MQPAIPLRQRLLALAKKELFFLIVLGCTVAAAAVRMPVLGAIHWNVISALFCLMLVCAGFERCSLLTGLAARAIRAFHTPRRLGMALILLTGVLAMLITNDVALITVVPITLAIARMSGENPALLIILETLSANILSSFTPFGNPQNLYLYATYHIPTAEFFGIMAPFCAVGLLLILAVNFLFNRGSSFATDVPPQKVTDKPLLTASLLGFLINVLSILRVLDYRAALAATVVLFLIFGRKLFLRVDYFLLATFVCFFLFTSSVTGIGAMHALFSHVLTSPAAVLLSAAAASQVISNVPAAALLSPFTPHYRELLLGVSAGGMGTLVASLASLISYKLYAAEYGAKKYLRTFSVLNFALLSILLAFLLLTLR